MNTLGSHEFSWRFLEATERDRKFTGTGGFRCGSRSCLRTSHVSDRIVRGGAEIVKDHELC